MGAILTQIDRNGKFHEISFVSKQLVKHEKNYSPFLLEMDAGVWAILPRAFKRKKVYPVYRPQTIGISRHPEYQIHESTATGNDRHRFRNKVQERVRNAGGLPIEKFLRNQCNINTRYKLVT
jgi:hypothetical protein